MKNDLQKQGNQCICLWVKAFSISFLRRLQFPIIIVLIKAHPSCGEI